MFTSMAIRNIARISHSSRLVVTKRRITARRALILLVADKVFPAVAIAAPRLRIYRPTCDRRPPYELRPATKFSLRPGMGRIVHLNNVLERELRVSLGRGQSFIAQQFLDGPQVCTLFQH